VRVTIPEKEGAVLRENICPASLILLIIVNWTSQCSGTLQGQTPLDCKRWTRLDESIIVEFIIGREVAVGICDCTPRAKSDIYHCLVDKQTVRCP